MTVSLEWLLAQRDLDLRLVTGDPATAALTWAHATDLDDPTPWLTVGEFILTTGLQLARTARAQRAYVERLADAGISGLGLGVGLRYDEIPRPIIDVCSERGLPLVEVPLPTPFIAITQAVARQLAEQERHDLEEALVHQRRMIRSAVRGGLRGLVTVLSRDLRCDAVVLDEYGAVMASSTQDNRLLERVAEERRRLASPGRRGAVGVEIDQDIVELQTLRGRSAVVGWLAIRRRGSASATERLLLNQAAGVITLLLDWPAELIAAYHALGGALLDLLLDPSQQAEELVRHLHHFGFGRTDQVRLVVLASPRSHARLLQVVNETLEATARPHLVSPVPGGIAALLVDRDAAMLADLLDRAVRDAGLARVVIGGSGSLPQTAVATGLAPAEQAGVMARLDQRRVGWFDEATLGVLVADEQIRSRIRTLTQPVIDALVRDAGPREADLLPSLEAFLHHNGSWEAAARAIGVHRHTLRSRMARVEELTGLPLDVAENRVLMLLALISHPGGEGR